ncbi:integrin alpha-IIb-like [Pelobates fuscus]|uniref:integrin alpha-IIb-like n=1 Tax=Pelobates fuscus TaxID=191477 RepID=UPI002FE48165
MEIGIFVLLLLLVLTTQALNLDEWKPRIFRGPSGSYFGFSLDFFQTAEKEMNLAVGAPKMQTLQPHIIRGGGVFMCPWDSKTRNCTMIEFDQTGDSINKYGDITVGVFKSDQFFGATVRTWKDSIVACAPLQHWNVSRHSDQSGLTPTGACYLSSNLQNFLEFAPCREMTTASNKRFCEIGFSAEIHKDGTLLAGGPGGYGFSGLYTTMNLSIIPNLQPSQYLLRNDFNQQTYPYSGMASNAYKGFSVAFGEFDGNNKPDLVIGAPTFNYMGTVEIFVEGLPMPAHLYRGDGDENSILRNSWRVVYTFRGDQIAAYYGHTVAVTDINKDGKDDVLIGAPLYQESRSAGKLQEVGRVYVYLQKKSSKLAFEVKILSGSRVYEQFGASIAPLGDLDQDGFQDIAVGAPFGGKSGGGCVYIYRGEDSGLSSKPSQVLESPLTPPSRFGFSLRGGTDIDDNGYPDLLVGAFEADAVYVYRSRPVVVVQTTLHFSPDALNPEDKFCNTKTGSVSCFILHVCVKVSGHNLPKTLNFLADLQLDRQKNLFSRRTLFLDTSNPTKNVTIQLQSNLGTVCKNFTVYLRGESEFRDKLSPIIVSVNLSLPNEYSADALQPVLHGTTFLQNQTHILLDCGEDNICIPNLHLYASWPPEALVIGTDNLVNVQFSASNSLEGAYEAELLVRLPAGAHYAQVFQVLDPGEEKVVCTPKKDNETELVVCELGNPMKNTTTIHAELQLAFSNLENYGSNITFPMQIKSRNSQNSSSSIVWVQLDVIVKASLELRGSSYPPEIILPLPKWEFNEEVEKKRPQDYGEEVKHVYELHNTGPGTVHAHLVVQIPERYEGDFFLYPLDIEVDDKMTCFNQSKLNPLELDFSVVTEAPKNYSMIGDQRLYKRDTDIIDAEDSTEEEEEIIALTEDGKKKIRTIHLNCSGVTCWEVQCLIDNLEQGQRATLTLHSILWIPSFMKRPQQPFTLLSQGSFQVTGVPYIVQPTTLLANDTTAQTSVLWISPDGQKEVPLWWVIVGVLAGLLILALFVFVMWKLGFFRRMRPPTDDQDELTNDQQLD